MENRAIWNGEGTLPNRAKRGRFGLDELWKIAPFGMVRGILPNGAKAEGPQAGAAREIRAVWNGEGILPNGAKTEGLRLEQLKKIAPFGLFR